MATRRRAAYEGYLALVVRLTNPLTGPDLRGPLATLDAGRSDVPEKGVSFFPASRAHETDLVMKLYGTRPIPEGFNLMDELIRAIRASAIDLTPTTGSGWYDYQTWSLEPLAAPERAAEAARLSLSASYRQPPRGALSRHHGAHPRDPHQAARCPGPPPRHRPARREPVWIVIRPGFRPSRWRPTTRAAAARLPVCTQCAGRDLRGRGTERPAPADPGRIRHGRACGRARHDGAFFAGASAAVSHDLGMAAPIAAPTKAPTGPAIPRPIATRFSAGRRTREPTPTWAAMCG